MQKLKQENQKLPFCFSYFTNHSLSISRNCSNSPVCYRTLRPYQSNSGCISSAKSDVCCEIQLNPFKDQKFTALKLKQPDTIFVLQYAIYSKRSKRWVVKYDKEFNFALNQGLSSMDLEISEDMRVTVGLNGGRPHRQMDTGMYFYGNNDKILRNGVRINDLTENSLEKLGWFRFEEDKWMVKRGLEKITKAQVRIP